METSKPQPDQQEEEQCYPDEQDLLENTKDSSFSKLAMSSNQIESESKHKEDDYEQRLDQEQLDSKLG